jgi:hypothetical protein
MSLEEAFPNCQLEPFIFTSPATNFYNCIAWAFEDPTRVYWPDGAQNCYWPPNIQRKPILKSFIDLFKSKGYFECENGNLEEGYLKVAIYSKNNIPTHAARQLSNGLWTSKLGRSNDVSHTIHAMSNGEYGDVAIYMKKPL